MSKRTYPRWVHGINPETQKLESRMIKSAAEENPEIWKDSPDDAVAPAGKPAKKPKAAETKPPEPEPKASGSEPNPPEDETEQELDETAQAAAEIGALGDDELAIHLPKVAPPDASADAPAPKKSARKAKPS